MLAALRGLLRGYDGGAPGTLWLARREDRWAHRSCIWHRTRGRGLRACRIYRQLGRPVCGIGDLRRWVEHATSHRVRSRFSGIRHIIAWPAGDIQLHGRPGESCNSRAGLTAAGPYAMAWRALAPCDAGRSRSGDCPSAHAADCPGRTGGRGRGGFWLLFVIGVLDTGVRMGLLTFLPFLLKARGVSLPAIGLALALVFIGGAVGKFVCGWLGARVGFLLTVLATEGGTAPSRWHNAFTGRHALGDARVGRRLRAGRGARGRRRELRAGTGGGRARTHRTRSGSLPSVLPTR